MENTTMIAQEKKNQGLSTMLEIKRFMVDRFRTRPLTRHPRFGTH
jgi:hypothetical protein